ncbi:hypothetical protein BvCmsKSP063_02753 [Escherichia coli]|nr:hypothetical protein BvCmsKSP063_02753 [Escherichia coli]
MMVVSNLYPLLLRIAGEHGELLTILFPAFLRETWAQVNRRLLLTVNAATHFRKNQYFCTQLSQQRQMRLHSSNLVLYTAFQQATGIPAGDQLQVVALQNGAEQARFSREFIAQFEAGKTGLFPFTQAGLQRCLRAQ